MLSTNSRGLDIVAFTYAMFCAFSAVATSEGQVANRPSSSGGGEDPLRLQWDRFGQTGWTVEATVEPDRDGRQVVTAVSITADTSRPITAAGWRSVNVGEIRNAAEEELAFVTAAAESYELGTALAEAATGGRLDDRGYAQLAEL